MGLSAVYTLSYSVVYFLIARFGSGSGANAFKMMGVWLLFCVVIPGAVHQYVSMTHPVSYMTDYLDTSRKETYATFSLPPETLADRLITLYPELTETVHGQSEEVDKAVIRGTLPAIINQMNKAAAVNIEQRNAAKIEA